ncbi:MAG: rRNA maturation RNase YbeY [Candidatus Eisenbacteria bacterium]|nr:rRNA maturation RNase YbeY [Candidatus Eisenbacteria bacterium]
MATRIINRQRQMKIDSASIRRLVDLILRDQDEAESDVSIVIARDDLLAGLNASFRDIDRPTDVLAFPMGPEPPRDSGSGGRTPGRGSRASGPGRRSTARRARGADPDTPGPETVLGDVVISVDRAIAQSKRYCKAPEQELLKLVAHGVLHLLGQDHANPSERRRMRNLEERYLRLLSRATQ